MEKVVLIMAGGSGTRFWPLSTTEKPKQFLDLISDKTMIRETIDRVSKLIPVERIFISTNISYLDIIKEQLPEIPEKNIIFEPMARDTAACIGYAALIIEKIYKNSIMAVLPSDHLIKKEKEFLKSLELAFKKAEEDVVVTLGIKPSYPETGYGYIEYFKKYSSTERKAPIILFFDNELSIRNKPLNKFSVKLNSEEKNRLKTNGYIQLNSDMKLFVMTMKLAENQTSCEIEDLFDERTLCHEDAKGRSFSREDRPDLNEFYGKDYFSKYVYSNYKQINFEKFKEVFNTIRSIMDECNYQEE